MTTKFFWLTGLSGSGKSTLAQLAKLDLDKKKIKTKIVDGDLIRTKLHKKLSFSPADIKKNNSLIIDYCLSLKNTYQVVLISVIAPFCETRDLARKKLATDYFEIYVQADFQTCARRDVKGLYQKVKKGQIENFIGLQIPYETPINPNLIIDTQNLSLPESSQILLDFIYDEIKS